MKKSLVTLIALTMLTVSGAYAANPVSNWLNKTADSIEATTSKATNSVKSETKKVENQQQSFIAKWKAKRAEAQAKREADQRAYEAKKANFDKEVKETKNAFKRLFTWDWE